MREGNYERKRLRFDPPPGSGWGFEVALLEPQRPAHLAAQLVYVLAGRLVQPVFDQGGVLLKGTRGLIYDQPLIGKPSFSMTASTTSVA